MLESEEFRLQRDLLSVYKLKTKETFERNETIDSYSLSGNHHK